MAIYYGITPTTGVVNQEVTITMNTSIFPNIGTSQQFYFSVNWGDGNTTTYTTSDTTLTHTYTTTGTFTIIVTGHNTYIASTTTSGTIPGTSTQKTTIYSYNVNTACYLKGTKILCLKDNEEKYICIEDLDENCLVKTLNHGYKKISILGFQKLLNCENKVRHKLYKLPKEKNDELIEDLYVTGQHSILVDKLTEKQKNDSLKYWSKLLKIEDKFLLQACVNEDFEDVKIKDEYILYQLVLEHENKNERYGIWANGILSETMSENTFYKKKQLDIFRVFTFEVKND